MNQRINECERRWRRSGAETDKSERRRSASRERVLFLHTKKSFDAVARRLGHVEMELRVERHSLRSAEQGERRAAARLVGEEELKSVVERVRHEHISPRIEDERVRRGEVRRAARRRAGEIAENERPRRRADRPAKEIVAPRVHDEQTARRRIEINIHRVEQLVRVQSTAVAAGDQLAR